MMASSIGWWGVVIGILAGAIRGGTPFMLVSLGECLTEKSGKINLGLEGVLLMGAMSAYAISYKTGNPWIGAGAAALAGAILGMLHALLVLRPKVNDIAAGIAGGSVSNRGQLGLRRGFHGTWRRGVAAAPGAQEQPRSQQD